MDAPLDPPLCPIPLSTRPISTKLARTHLNAFLAAFHNRSTLAKGGDKAITTQLLKLSAALRKERQR